MLSHAALTSRHAIPGVPNRYWMRKSLQGKQVQRALNQTGRPMPRASRTRSEEQLSWREVWTARLRWTAYFVSGCSGLHLFLNYSYTMGSTYGISMLPTLSSFGDWTVVSAHYRRGRDVKVGDMVSFIHPNDAKSRALKRVLGMPGDFVLATTPGAPNAVMLQVPQGHCWVVGDNVNNSRDSRHFGPLPLNLITGKIVAIIDASWNFSWANDAFVRDD